MGRYDSYYNQGSEFDSPQDIIRREVDKKREEELQSEYDKIEQDTDEKLHRKLNKGVCRDENGQFIDCDDPKAVSRRSIPMIRSVLKKMVLSRLNGIKDLVLTRTQQETVDHYDLVVADINDICSDNGDIQEISAKVGEIIKRMMDMGFPSRDVAVFRSVQNSILLAQAEMADWNEGIDGTPIDELETYFGLPEGALR